MCATWVTMHKEAIKMGSKHKIKYSVEWKLRTMLTNLSSRSIQATMFKLNVECWYQTSYIFIATVVLHIVPHSFSYMYTLTVHKNCLMDSFPNSGIIILFSPTI